MCIPLIRKCFCPQLLLFFKENSADPDEMHHYVFSCLAKYPNNGNHALITMKMLTVLI